MGLLRCFLGVLFVLHCRPAVQVPALPAGGDSASCPTGMSAESAGSGKAECCPCSSEVTKRLVEAVQCKPAARPSCSLLWRSTVHSRLGLQPGKIEAGGHKTPSLINHQWVPPAGCQFGSSWVNYQYRPECHWNPRCSGFPRALCLHSSKQNPRL